MKKVSVIIIGAGCAGLTSAYKLLESNNNYDITILEKSNYIGGLARNEYYNGNIIDLGGHRFFSKNKEVNELWERFLPLINETNKNNDNILLQRKRISHIYYLNKFFDYPLSISLKTFKNLGIKNTFKAGFSYLHRKSLKLDNTNLENFYINRFGKYFYDSFFYNYTYKLWGVEPSKIDASWGYQRVKGLSLKKAINHAIKKSFIRDNQKVEGSLVGSFSYPKYGPGQMYEVIADYLITKGVKIIKNAEVTIIDIKDNKVNSVTVNKKDKYPTDILISSMPLNELILSINNKEINDDIKKKTCLSHLLFK